MFKIIRIKKENVIRFWWTYQTLHVEKHWIAIDKKDGSLCSCVYLANVNHEAKTITYTGHNFISERMLIIYAKRSGYTLKIIR